MGGMKDSTLLVPSKLPGAHREHLSFRELARRPELPFHPKYLYRSLRLVEQLRLLPEGPLEGPEFSDDTDQQGRALIEAMDELFDKYQATRPQWVERFGEG